MRKWTLIIDKSLLEVAHTLFLSSIYPVYYKQDFMDDISSSIAVKLYTVFP